MATSRSGWYWHLAGASLLAIGGALAYFGDCALAQIVPDSTLGRENSTVKSIGSVDQINGGATRGANLFHSFDQFSVLTGREAYFNNDSNIQNIFSRVTGESISNIDGLIRANGTANLFLLNPNGIIFGPNASLSIEGSFLGSTASRLNFADGTQFSATAPQITPLLTVSVPIGLQYGQNPGSIRNQSQATTNNGERVGLQIQPGRTLALVGGDVALEGSNLTAYAGRIELGSVAGSSLVSLAPTASGWALGYEGVQNFRDIQLSSRLLYGALVFGDNIQVRSRQVTISDYSSIQFTTNLVVTASELVEVSDGGELLHTIGSGAAGNLTITTGKLIVRDGASVSDPSFLGSWANLTVRASESVEIIGIGADNNSSSLSTNYSGDEAGGDLTIETGQLAIRDGAKIATNTSGAGDAGDLIIRASDSVKVSGGGGILALTTPGSTGAGGDLTIETKRLEGTQLAVRSLGQGPAGTLAVITPESLPNVEMQIVPDKTLPTNSTVRSDFNTSIVEGGTQVGSNLFHSFAQFSIPTGGTIYFNNALDIQNIISRVTGSSASNIDGFLQANGTANLFLLNPNGIIFSRDALLNIGGSFLGSTASAVNFADGTPFSATAPQVTPTLTMSVPTGLQFESTAESIFNQSSLSTGGGEIGLQVQPGNTLALVGGDVRLDGGTLQASGGFVELGGVLGAGTVGLTVNGNDLRLSFPDGVRRADVSLTRASISASSLDSYITNNDGFGESVTVIPAGSIAINARNISVLEGSSLSASTIYGGEAGEIMLNATGAITLASEAATDSLSSSRNISFQVDGTRGVINMKAKSISLTRSDLNAGDPLGSNAGSISLQADDSVSLANSFILGTGPYVGGSGGEINIKAKSVSITGGSQVNPFALDGISGNININASSSVSISDSAFITSAINNGRGGNINIKASSFSLNNGAQLNTRTFGDSPAGNIVVIADSVTFSGVNSFGLSSGLFTSSEGASFFSERSARSGDIRIDTGILRVSDGAVVNARTRSDGIGGNITVNTNTLELTDGGQLLTTAFSSGRAGDITVNATDSVVISGGDPTFAARVAQSFIDPFTSEPFQADVDNDGPASGLLSRVQGDQATNAGNIKVTAGSIRLDNQGTITAETTLGDGGNITLKAGDILLRNDSNITATAGTTSANGNGGNVTIDTDLLVALENSDITANAFEGRGGNVQINTQGRFLSLNSKITASSERGIDGEVTFNTPDVDPSAGLVALPAEVVDASRLIAQTCPAGGGQGQSEFIVTGRGGLPENPSDTLSSDAVEVDLVTLYPKVENRSSPNVSTLATSLASAPIVEAQGWVIGANGEVILTATAPTVTPYSPGLTSAQCHTPKSAPKH